MKVRSITHPRLFVRETLATDAQIVGSANHARYLGTVLRLPVGAPVRVFNATDGEFAATIEDLGRDHIVLRIAEHTRAQSPEADRWLLFAPLKRDATDTLIRMATELGVSALLPVITGRTNSDRINLDRLAALTIEAAEQCERLTLPRLDPPARLGDVLAKWDASRRLFAALERADAPPITPCVSPCALLVGPEGGFSPAEQARLADLPFVSPVTLGPLVLRADTAAAAGLSRLA